MGNMATVDGHDFGSGEANIFILTDYPEETINTVRPYLDNKGVLASMIVTYRRIDSNEFKVLWPNEEAEFRIV